MDFYKVQPKNTFVGRVAEQSLLSKIGNSAEASIVVVHGRRRVGKTALIEQAFGKRSLLKFEGIEGQDSEYQRIAFLKQLSIYPNLT